MWIYQNKVIDSLEKFPKGTYGFIYKITCLDTGQFYIGRKNLYSERTKLLTKKELVEHTGKGKKPTKKKIITESDWKAYFSSNNILKGMVKKLGQNAFKREIIDLCYSKKETTYKEMKHQCILNVLENDKSLNDNILGKFFKKDIYDGSIFDNK